jgi:hypothetical protein
MSLSMSKCWYSNNCTIFFICCSTGAYCPCSPILIFVRTRLFENLRMLPHAPGVQMADIPEDGVDLKAEGDLMDEANPDKRNPQQVNKRFKKSSGS